MSTTVEPGDGSFVHCRERKNNYHYGSWLHPLLAILPYPGSWREWSRWTQITSTQNDSLEQCTRLLILTTSPYTYVLNSDWIRSCLEEKWLVRPLVLCTIILKQSNKVQRSPWCHEIIEKQSITTLKLHHFLTEMTARSSCGESAIMWVSLKLKTLLVFAPRGKRQCTHTYSLLYVPISCVSLSCGTRVFLIPVVDEYTFTLCWDQGKCPD